MKKFYRFLLFINICVILVFTVFYFKNEISSFIYSQTGISFSIPELDLSWVVFWRKDDTSTASSVNFQSADNTSDNSNPTENAGDAPQSEQAQDQSSFDKRIASLQGNTVIGIHYAGINSSPEAMALKADRIVKIKVKSVRTVAYENVVYSEIVADVRHTYKGRETEEIQLFAYGGEVNVSDLKTGQIRESASKTTEYGDTVNVLMDFCEEIEEGRQYIVFVSDNNGVVSPVCGNMSFFKIQGRNVVRKSSEEQDFSMRLSKFENEYLNSYK